MKLSNIRYVIVLSFSCFSLNACVTNQALTVADGSGADAGTIHGSKVAKDKRGYSQNEATLSVQIARAKRSAARARALAVSYRKDISALHSQLTSLDQKRSLSSSERSQLQRRKDALASRIKLNASRINDLEKEIEAQEQLALRNRGFNGGDAPDGLQMNSAENSQHLR